MHFREASGLKSMTQTVFLSTVTPVYRGAKTLRELVEALGEVRRELESRNSPIHLAESIFVDDGSEDGSMRLLRELSAEHPWVTLVCLSRNYGQHPATMAGILHASGDWIATLDEDLQHHPRHLLGLLKLAVSEGYDVVYANPQARVHQSLFRDLGSSLYKWLIGRLSDNPNVRLFNSFRMMRGSVARAASAVAAHSTYFDIAVSWFTSRIGTKTLPLLDLRYARERESGYRFGSLLSHARRLLHSSDASWIGDHFARQYGPSTGDGYLWTARYPEGLRMGRRRCRIHRQQDSRRTKLNQ
jgi:glycosyltransferase involved in cell wall biosynthesis